jgi:uncharacterized protein (UPF0297 family)
MFNYAVMFSKWLEERFQLTIASDEIGYLAKGRYMEINQIKKFLISGKPSLLLRIHLLKEVDNLLIMQ